MASKVTGGGWSVMARCSVIWGACPARPPVSGRDPAWDRLGTETLRNVTPSDLDRPASGQNEKRLTASNHGRSGVLHGGGIRTLRRTETPMPVFETGADWREHPRAQGDSCSISLGGVGLRLTRLVFGPTAAAEQSRQRTVGGGELRT
jgi:hypothetical protein